MPTNDFFDNFFAADFWTTIKRRSFPTDHHSMFGDEETFRLLIERFRPSTIIEVGSWKGHSANFMADLCKRGGIQARILCIDTFLGAVEHWHLPDARPQLFREFGRPTIFERFLGNTIARGNEAIIFPLTLDSTNAAALLALWQVKADLIYVDAAHDAASVAADLTRFHPLLSENGVMFGDDYQFEPLADAVHAFAAEHAFHVLVSSRKWLLVTPGMIASLFAPSFAMRVSREGWVHP